MAKEVKNLNINGEDYELIRIYSEMGMSFERFVELLERDFYCPTLSAAPTSSTLTYTDTDGSENDFQVGQPCRWMEDGGYRMAYCRGITGTSADWYVLPASFVTAEDLSAKQDKALKFENVQASGWVSDSTYADFPYRCDMACEGVTVDMYAEVVFDLAHATSGNYAPLCETKTDAVSIWSSSEAAITVPTIIITR